MHRSVHHVREELTEEGVGVERRGKLGEPAEVREEERNFALVVADREEEIARAEQA